MPILYLDNTVLFPGTTLVAKFNDNKSIQVINYCIQNNLPLLIQLYPIIGKNISYGTVAKIHHNSLKFDKKTNVVQIILEGTSRAKVNQIIQHIPYTIAEVEFKHENHGESIISNNKISKIKSLIENWANNEVKNSKDREKFITKLDSFPRIINYACFLLIRDPELQELLLESDSLTKRFQLLSNILLENRKQFDQTEFLVALKNFADVPKSNICH